MEWIKCSERMPEVQMEVLYYSCDGLIGMGVVHSALFTHSAKPLSYINNEGYELILDDYITHWQPLPNPPEG